MSSPRRSQRQAGFNLLELALVVALLGGMVTVLMQYRSSIIGSDDSEAEGVQEQVIAALYRYAERQFRLPCADTDGDGVEGEGSGCGDEDSAFQVGGVPYSTLGLSDLFSSGTAENYIYGVYRNSSLDADLAAVEERTGDSEGDGGYRQLDDLRYALRTLADASLDTSHIHVTGDVGYTGDADCSTNPVVNVAFFVLYAGTEDADGDGSLFDGENATLSWPSGGAFCVQGQTTRTSEAYDDAVIAVGFAELLGYLSQ